ncbi:MAG: hypothetical protein ACLPVF_05285, partial [Acidimicrobiales bacterium]
MRRRRTALPLLAASAAAIALVAWPALAAATAAGATAGGSAAVPAGTPACTDSWVGLASSPQWTIPSNWSTGEVPGPSSDVCITTTGDDVLTDVSIRIHSLQIGSEQGIALEGTPAEPLTAEVAEDVDLTPGFFGRIDMTDARIDAAQIDDQGGTIYTDGTCALDSSDVVFGSGGILDADGGTTTVTGLPQLSDGTLTGGTINALGAVVVLPGDVSHLVSAHVTVAENSAVDDPAGDNALTGLTSIDAQSSLTDESDLPLTGSLVADGNVSFGGPAVSLAGTLTQAEGT